MKFHSGEYLKSQFDFLRSLLLKYRNVPDKETLWKRFSLMSDHESDPVRNSFCPDKKVPLVELSSPFG